MEISSIALQPAPAARKIKNTATYGTRDGIFLKVIGAGPKIYAHWSIELSRTFAGAILQLTKLDN
jgi:hypothetical protein